MDDMDVTRSMAEVAQSRWLAEQPLLYTVEEAAAILRIGRTLAYDSVQRFETSGGREGLPAVRVGHSGGCRVRSYWRYCSVSRTVGTAWSCQLPFAVKNLAASRGRDVRAGGSGGSRRVGSSEQLFLLPPSD